MVGYHTADQVANFGDPQLVVGEDRFKISAPKIEHVLAEIGVGLGSIEGVVGLGSIE